MMNDVETGIFENSQGFVRFDGTSQLAQAQQMDIHPLA